MDTTLAEILDWTEEMERVRAALVLNRLDWKGECILGSVDKVYTNRLWICTVSPSCHICGSKIAENDASAEEVEDGFECNDCGKITCNDCKSIGISRDNPSCQLCRG